MASKTRYKTQSPTPAFSTEESAERTTHTSRSTHGPRNTRNSVLDNSIPHSLTSQSQSTSGVYDRHSSKPRSPYMSHFSPHLQHGTFGKDQERFRESSKVSSVREEDYSNFSQSKPPAEIDYPSTDSLVSTSTDTAMPEWIPPSHYSSQTSTLPMFIEPTYHNSHLLHLEQVAGKPIPLQPSFPGPQFPTPITSISLADDRHRPRQLSIQSILSSPGLPTPSATFGNGQGCLKRKKDEEEEIRLRTEGIKEVKGLEGIEDPDVRLAAEALGDLRADFNHSSTHQRRSPSLNRSMHPSHLHLSTPTPSTSSSSSTNATSLNSPRSPSSAFTHTQYSPSISPSPLPEVPPQQTHQKPLIDLLSASSPIINTVVQRSAAAYTETKNYSPKFRYAAEIGERFVGASGTLVGKKMGGDRLEFWVRSKLVGSMEQGKGDEKSHDIREREGVQINGDMVMNGAPVINKKRKTSTGDVHGVNGHGNGCALQSRPNGNRQEAGTQTSSQQQPNWQTRMMITTSGFTVAMSEESFKSLQYCFSWLRAANAHLSKMIETLQRMLAEYEASLYSSLSPSPSSPSSNCGTITSRSASYSSDQEVLSKFLPEKCESRRQRFLNAIETVKEDVLNTIRKVINVVDDYAGGALTGEVRSMVKRQILLLPRRISYVLARSSVGTNPAVQGVVRRLASAGSDAEGKAEVRQGRGITEENGRANGDVEKGYHYAEPPVADPRVNANKVLLIAKEGFEMMQNVTRLVEETLLSAEEWCEKLGRRPGSIHGEAVGTMMQQEQARTQEGQKWISREECDVEMAEANNGKMERNGEVKLEELFIQRERGREEDIVMR